MDKPKFNVIDGLIIIAILLIAVVGVFLIRGMAGGSVSGTSTNTNAVFKIELAKAEPILADQFAAAMDSDETVWIGVKERFEGKIQNVEVKPSQKVTTDLRTGKAVLGSDPTCLDVTITVKAQAVETDSAITASGTAIRVGEEVAIRGKQMAGFGYVVELKTVND